MGEGWRCHWCGKTYKTQRAKSDWEQKASSGEYKGMCNRCATRRLGNPWCGLLDMRRVEATDGA